MRLLTSTRSQLTGPLSGFNPRFYIMAGWWAEESQDFLNESVIDTVFVNTETLHTNARTMCSQTLTTCNNRIHLPINWKHYRNVL